MSIPEVEIKDNITDASEFLAYLRLSNEHWLAQNATRSDWVFRGQANQTWGLESTAMRKSNNNILRYLIDNARKAGAYDKEANGLFNDPNNPHKFSKEKFKNIIYDLFGQVEIENELVALFVNHCDESGLTLPEDKTPFKSDSSHTLDLKSQTIHNDDGVVKNRIDSLGRKSMFYEETVQAKESIETLYHLRIEFMLAQHHGIPTRLLDWTHSPLIAAYFSANDPIHMDSDVSKRPEVLAVWAIYPPAYHHSNIWFDKPYTSKIDYLRAQKGLFSVDMNMNTNFLNTGKWRTIEEIPIESIDKNAVRAGEEDFFNRPLVKITLPVSERRKLLTLLEAEGITEPAIKPAFDTVGTYISTRIRDNNSSL